MAFVFLYASVFSRFGTIDRAKGQSSLENGQIKVIYGLKISLPQLESDVESHQELSCPVLLMFVSHQLLILSVPENAVMSILNLDNI